MKLTCGRMGEVGSPSARTVRFGAIGLAGVVALLILAGCQASPATVGSAAQSGEVVDAALHAKLPERILQTGTVRVAIDPGSAPAEFFAADGRTVVGFDPDLAAALGRLLGVRFTLVTTPFDSAIDATADGTTDLIISDMTDTLEREKRIDFVHYFLAGTAVVVQQGNPDAIGGVTDLCGLRVGVETDTIQVDQARRLAARCPGTGFEITKIDSETDAQLDLRTGRIEALLLDYPLAAYLATTGSGRGNYQLASDSQFEPAPYGIGVSKTQPQLRDAVRAALQKLMDNGGYDAILKRWQVNGGAMHTASVNLVAQT